MVCKRTKIKRITSDFIKRLRKKGIPVELVYLFGSYAWGRPTSSSDIDIAVVSSKFENMDSIERIEFLSDIARYVSPNLDVDIDVVGFTSKEMKNASYFDLASEIYQRGQILYKKSPSSNL